MLGVTSDRTTHSCSFLTMFYILPSIVSHTANAGGGHGGGARHTIASLSSKLGRASFTTAQCEGFYAFLVYLLCVNAALVVLCCWCILPDVVLFRHSCEVRIMHELR